MKKDRILQAVFCLVLTVFIHKAEAQTCTGFTTTYASANNWQPFTVTDGQVYCIPNGQTVSVNITIQTGGTLCIASGGTMQQGSLTLQSGGNLFVSENGTITGRPTINYRSLLPQI